MSCSKKFCGKMWKRLSAPRMLRRPFYPEWSANASLMRQNSSKDLKRVRGLPHRYVTTKSSRRGDSKDESSEAGTCWGSWRERPEPGWPQQKWVMGRVAGEAWDLTSRVAATEMLGSDVQLRGAWLTHGPPAARGAHHWAGAEAPLLPGWS